MLEVNIRNTNTESVILLLYKLGVTIDKKSKDGKVDLRFNGRYIGYMDKFVLCLDLKGF